MSDKKFSVETQIANRLRNYLIDNGFRIVQLVPPGGQCPLSLSYTHPETLQKKTCFPDLLCYSDEEVLVGEMKPRFSLPDRRKLLSIKNSVDGRANITRILIKRDPRFTELPIIFALVHAQETHSSDDEVEQLIMTSEQKFIHLPVSGERRAYSPAVSAACGLITDLKQV